VAEKLGTAVLELSTDQKDYDKGLRTAKRKAIELSESLTRVGRTLSAAITLPFAALSGLAVKASSDLNESMNAVNVVFGQSAKIIEGWGATASKNVGLAQAEFNEMATVLGSMLKQTGAPMAEVADNTIMVTQRAADMASVFNTDVKQALVAIQAALRGETEPIRKFGVLLNEAAVKAKAVELGLIDANEQMSESQKVTARLAAIMEQTSQVAGDFGNTSDQLANRLRILKARATDIIAEFGKSLVPVLESLLTVAEKVISAFAGMSDNLKKLVLILGGLAAAAGPVSLFAGNIMKLVRDLGSLAGMLSPTGLVIAGVTALTTAVVAGAIETRRLKEELANTARVSVSEYNKIARELDKIAFTTGNLPEDIKRFADESGFALETVVKIAKQQRIIGDELDREVAKRRDELQPAVDESVERLRWIAGQQERTNVMLEENLEVEKKIVTELGKQAQLRQEIIGQIRSGLEQAAAQTTILARQWAALGNIGAEAMAKAIGEPQKKVAQEIVSLVESISVELAIQEASAEGLKRWQVELLKLYEEAQVVLSDQTSELEEQANYTRMMAEEAKAMRLEFEGMQAALPELGAGGGVEFGLQAPPQAEEEEEEEEEEGFLAGMTEPLTALAMEFLNALIQAASELEYFGKLLDSINFVAEIIVNAFGNILNVLAQAFIPILKQVAQIFIANLYPILNAITPILQIFAQLLSFILPTIAAVIEAFQSLRWLWLEILLPVIKALASAFAVVLTVVRVVGELFAWLMEHVKTLGKNIEIAIWKITHPLRAGERSFVRGPGAFRTTAGQDFEALIASIWATQAPAAGMPTAPPIEVPGIEEGIEGGAGVGAGATYEQARPINITIHIEDNNFNGAGGLREFAILLRDELESLGVLGI